MQTPAQSLYNAIMDTSSPITVSGSRKGPPTSGFSTDSKRRSPPYRSTRCNQDVVWCTESCRSADESRHDFECTWLAKYTKPLQSKWGEYNFGMLWLIVRILSRRYIELQHGNDTTNSNTNEDGNTLPADSALSNFKFGWPAIEALCGTTETWSHAQVREWTVLAKKYLSSSALPHKESADTVLGLICKEEANSFGLYPRETGHYPPLDPPVSRGEQFGAAVYPRASIANHSCCPNIIHKSDKHGRMIFTANRDIPPGEECCIAYFDMTQRVELKERREHLASLFRFKCGCPRCTDDEKKEDVAKEKEQGPEQGKPGENDIWGLPFGSDTE